MQNVKVSDEHRKFADGVEDFVTGNLDKLDKLKVDALIAMRIGLVLQDERVEAATAEKYKEKLTMIKKRMREEMDDVEEMAKKYKPKVLNVWWIDGLALEGEAFNKGNFLSKHSFCFPKLGLHASSPWKT